MSKPAVADVSTPSPVRAARSAASVAPTRSAAPAPPVPAAAAPASPAPAPPALAPAAPAPTFTIGELAREFDLTTRAIRFYEDRGLLSPRRSGRHRVYSARDRTRLRLTLRGKRLGLTLAEVRALVDLYESPRDTVPQLRQYLAVLALHRAELEQRLRELQQTLSEVRGQEGEAARLLEGRPGRRAPSAAAAAAAAVDMDADAVAVADTGAAAAAACAAAAAAVAASPRPPRRIENTLEPGDAP